MLHWYALEAYTTHVSVKTAFDKVYIWRIH